MCKLRFLKKCNETDPWGDQGTRRGARFTERTSLSVGPSPQDAARVGKDSICLCHLPWPPPNLRDPRVNYSSAAASAKAFTKAWLVKQTLACIITLDNFVNLKKHAYFLY